MVEGPHGKTYKHIQTWESPSVTSLVFTGFLCVGRDLGVLVSNVGFKGCFQRWIMWSSATNWGSALSEIP